MQSMFYSLFCIGLLSWQAIIYSDVVKSRIQSDDPTNPKYKGIP